MNAPVILIPGTMPAVAAEVAERLGVPYADLVGRSRRRKVQLARQEAMWLMWEMRWADGRRRHCKAAIGRFFDHVDHTSAVHGIRAHEARQALQEQAA